MGTYCTKCKWNPYTGGYTRDWIADDESPLTADFDPDSNPGSTVFVISTKEVWVKNSQKQWQKAGTTEVMA